MACCSVVRGAGVVLRCGAIGEEAIRGLTVGPTDCWALATSSDMVQMFCRELWATRANSRAELREGRRLARSESARSMQNLQ